ncbi:kelch-like protein diablo isoform X2 [Palaemon carinicauda]|uniref:kelch-like protein diablo isoform X2 n=1 Tax=Palaemon carinicauda TaxID=392227 RepID=UPI0035B5FE34
MHSNAKIANLHRIHRIHQIDQDPSRYEAMKTEGLTDNGWPTALSIGLHSAWERQLFTDIVIKTQDEVIHAHKIVLAAASPYFHAMLSGGLMEGLTQTLVLEDIPGDLIRAILTYIYTGTAPLTENNVQEVLTLSDYFQIHALRKLCCYYLANNLTVENCLGVYELAKLHNCFDLSSSSLYVATSQCSEIISHPTFLSVHPETVLKLLEQSYLSIDSEDELLKAVIEWVSNSPSSRAEWLCKLLEKIKMDLVASEVKLKSLETLRERKLLTKEVKEVIFPYDPVDGNSYEERLRNNDHREEVLLVMAGESNGRVLRNIECFKMGLPSWQCTLPSVALRVENQIDNSIVLPCMNDARAYCAVATYNNLVYVIGGQTNNSFLASVERFNIRKNKWDKLSPLPLAIHGTAAAFLDGSLYVAGGKTSVQHENRSWVYDMDKDTWVSREPMINPRLHHGLAALHGSLYAIGGIGPLGANHQVHTSCEKYDPGSDTWMPIASLSRARAYLGVAVIDDYLYAVGGYDGSYWLNSVERYDPLQDQWCSVSSMVSPRSSFGITVSSGRIYCIGGFSGESNLNTVEKYNPSTDTWHCVQSMQLRRYGGVAATVLVPFLPKPNP